MKELTTRLRDTASKGVSVWGDLQMEAADTIERLERVCKERDALQSTLDMMQVHESTLEDKDKVIEQLEAELAKLKQQEPVAWLYEAATPGGFFQEMSATRKTGNYIDPNCWEETALYLAAGARRPRTPLPAGYQLVPIEPTKSSSKNNLNN